MKTPNTNCIQLQQSLIAITNDDLLHKDSGNKDELTINIVFSFDTTILPNAKKLCKISSKDINKAADLVAVGTIALINQNLIVSMGDQQEFQLANYLKTLKAIANYVNNNSKITRINLIIEEQIAKLLNFEIGYYTEQTLFHIINYLYYFDELKSKRKKLKLNHISLVTADAQQKEIKNSTNNAIALLEGLFLIKHLANNPANIVTPTYLANTATSLAKLSKKAKVEILDKKDLSKLKMHAFLAVSQGSIEEPKFIKLTYNGATNAKEKPIVLVGKGITFDSGGISLKPSANMDNMKFDMCGAATVLGLFNTAVKLNLPINLICLIPTCENMPSGSAVKPGDVVTTMSGQTVEIANTDAEGRLILCDALTYATQFNPELVIDLATLTGACIIALGNVASGLYSNDPTLATQLTDAATITLDKVWQMPLFEEYAEMLKGTTADLSNIGSWKGAAGSVTAACFLAKFVNYKWAHLDIAGTADGESIYNSSNYHAATGRPFYMLIEFLRKQV